MEQPPRYTGGLLDPIRMPATMSGGRATVLGHSRNCGSSYPWSGTIIGDSMQLHVEAGVKKQHHSTRIDPDHDYYEVDRAMDDFINIVHADEAGVVNG